MLNFNKTLKISKENYFGIKNENNTLSFYIPEILEEEINNDRKIFETLKVYTNILVEYTKNKRKENNSLKFSDSLPTGDSLNVLNGCIKLIDDYIKNDEFFIFNSFYEKSHKKINWQKTLNNKDIIISNNQIIYNSFISSKKQRHLKNEMLQIYYYTLNYALSLFNYNYAFDIINMPFNHAKIKSIINNFLDNSYKDRDIFIGITLKEIYDRSFEKDLDSLFKTPFIIKFENIWEYLIEETIPEDLNSLKEIKNKVNFTGTYRIIKNEEKSTNTSFRIDHLIKKENEIFILDSKFYNSYYDHKFPNTSDIGKQENYKNIVKKETNISSIKNFFIFPKNEGDIIEYFAIHELNTNCENFKIYCLAFNIRDVIEIYNKKKKNENIFSSIKKQIEIN